MDAIALLESDHREVDAILDRIVALEEDDADERASLFEDLLTKLKAHETIEQEIFYPAAREAGEEAEDIVSHSYVEHHLVDVLVGEIQETSPGDEEWGAKAHVLKELIGHHVDEERGELFPAVRKGLEKDQLIQLGERMQARKDELLGVAVGAASAGTPQRKQAARRSGSKRPSPAGGTRKTPSRKTSAKRKH